MAKKNNSALYRALILILLFIFLLGGGYYLAIISKDSAHRIGGGNDYERMAKNSDDYNSTVQTKDGASAFFDKNDISNMQKSDMSAEEMNNKLLHAGVREKAKENLSKGSSLSMASSIASERIDNTNAAFFETQVQLGSLSGAIADNSFSSGNYKAKLVNAEKPQEEAAAEADVESGLLGALKGALRNSILGKRSASKDTAKDWIAKSFDGNAAAEYAIQYDEKMRHDLDYLDPKSMPQFLRQQEQDLDEGKKVDNSNVGDIAELTDYDLDETKPLASISYETSHSSFDKVVDLVLPGMMNVIFTGLIPKYERPVKNPYDIVNSNLSSGLPHDAPTMEAIDDEDLIVYGSKKGFQIVYDMHGNFIGCMDNVTYSFKVAGAPGCPR